MGVGVGGDVGVRDGGVGDGGVGDGGVGDGGEATLRSMLGSPLPRPESTFFLDLVHICAFICAGVKVGSSSSSSAVAPAASGAAMEVPLFVEEPVSEELEAETMLTPGAMIALQVP